MSAIVREGTIAGILAGTAVVLWFLGSDFFLGQPLATPETLGRALFGLLEADLGIGVSVPVVFGYTIFHYVAFILFGIIVSLVIRRAADEPSLLAGALILFVMLEVAFHALLSMFGSIPLLGLLAWYNVAIGNFLAALVMGAYMWKVHPELKAEFVMALGEEQ